MRRGRRANATLWCTDFPRDLRRKACDYFLGREKINLLSLLTVMRKEKLI